MSVPEAGANEQDVFLINPGLVYDKFRYPPYLPFIYRAVEVYCDRRRGNRRELSSFVQVIYFSWMVLHDCCIVSMVLPAAKEN